MGRVVRARDRGEPQPHLLQLVTYLPHSRQLSSLGSLHPADRFDPVRVQRSKVGRRGKAAGDPLRLLLRRHCHRRRFVVWWALRLPARKEFGVLLCVTSFVGLEEEEGRISK